jgi:hypothetical protein
LGNASWSDIAAIADRTESGTVMPLPVANAGVCDTTAYANWGDPLQTGSPCADYLPLVFSPGDLTMNGGHGQGLLVVAGVLNIVGNASFTGAIVARDGLSIGPGARIRGAAISRAGYALIDDADVTYSPCSLARSVAGTAATRRLIPEARRFLPAF